MEIKLKFPVSEFGWRAKGTGVTEYSSNNTKANDKNWYETNYKAYY